MGKGDDLFLGIAAELVADHVERFVAQGFVRNLPLRKHFGQRGAIPGFQRREGELVIADSATCGLWESTCFEAFLTEEGQPDYTEFNYAPDGRWACYQFDDYRSLLRSDELAPWEMTVERSDARYILRVEPGIFPDTGSKLGLSAVIEELDGTKSYWALAHPPGKPDFHHPDCFALTLEAPDAA